MIARNYRTLAILWTGLIIGAALVLGVGATRGEAAALLKGSFRGNAYATFANAEAGPVATQLGRSAYLPCPCQGTGGKTLSNTVDSVEAGEDGRVLTANVTLSTVFTEKTATSARVKNTSKVTGLSALDDDDGTTDPLVKADAIRAVANTSATARSIKSSPRGSEFVNLRIAGQRIRADVAPNTKVRLPGLGYVLLKSVKKGGNGKSLSTISVDMLTVVVERENRFGLPIGSRIVVAHAFSGFSRSEPEVIVGGQAYAATAVATAGDDFSNRVGKLAFITVGCEGTNSRVRSNNVNTLDVADTDVLSVGTGKTTAFGGPTPSGTVARTTATVEDLSLLNDPVSGNPLITADLVRAVAEDTFANGERTSSTRGSRFVGLEVAGQPIDASSPPNTRVTLPGIGFVVINEQIVPDPGSSARLQVNGLRIKVTRNNTLGLPIGTQIVVAHADSTAVRFRA
jgi:hypothetical protein